MTDTKPTPTIALTEEERARIESQARRASTGDVPIVAGQPFPLWVWEYAKDVRNLLSAIDAQAARIADLESVPRSLTLTEEQRAEIERDAQRLHDAIVSVEQSEDDFHVSMGWFEDRETAYAMQCVVCAAPNHINHLLSVIDAQAARIKDLEAQPTTLKENERKGILRIADALQECGESAKDMEDGRASVSNILILPIEGGSCGAEWLCYEGADAIHGLLAIVYAKDTRIHQLAAELAAVRRTAHHRGLVVLGLDSYYSWESWGRQDEAGPMVSPTGDTEDWEFCPGIDSPDWDPDWPKLPLDSEGFPTLTDEQAKALESLRTKESDHV